jgi:hypothetical protein
MGATSHALQAGGGGGEGHATYDMQTTGDQRAMAMRLEGNTHMGVQMLGSPTRRTGGQQARA